MRVCVTPAAPAQRPLIEGQFQLYVHDFSQWEPPGSPRFRLDDAGRFGPYPHLDSYWGGEGRWPLLIGVDDETAGFALINSETHSGELADWNMAEFFVARKFRGQGVAAEAVRLILLARPGRWEIAVAGRNAPAKRFWPRAIEAAGVSELSALQGDGASWTGPIWRFLSPGS